MGLMQVKLITKVKPVYYPQNTQSSIKRMNLSLLDTKEWMVVDEDFQQFSQHKQETLCKSYYAMDQSIDAQHELHNILLEHLVNDHDCYTYNGTDYLEHNTGIGWNTTNKDLYSSSKWVQEDICILQPVQGEYRLTAASVCSPSSWVLEEKMGKTITEIHSPVPDFDKVVAKRLETFLRALKPENPVMRYNWSYSKNNELSQRPDVSVEQNGRYWRVERQTMRKLPATGAIVFTIRIFIHPIEQLGEQANQDLTELFSRLPQEELEYKNISEGELC